MPEDGKETRRRQRRFGLFRNLDKYRVIVANHQGTVPGIGRSQRANPVLIAIGHSAMGDPRLGIDSRAGTYQ